MAEKPEFQIQLKGAGLKPETVRASDLALFLTNLEGAVIETAKSQNIPLAYDPDEVLVSLVRVEPGNSNDLTIAVARPISSAVSVMSQAITERQFPSLSHETQEYLHDISSQAIRMRWACEFHPVNGLLVAPAVISYEYPVPKPALVDTTRGTSTIWGHLIKAGGDSDPKAIIRLRNGKLFAARVTKELIDEIQDQKLIYKDIGLKGVAVWNLDDWSMVSFKAASIAAYRPDQVTPAQNFEELAKASRGRWEGVNPVKFVNGLRTEGE